MPQRPAKSIKKRTLTRTLIAAVSAACLTLPVIAPTPPAIIPIAAAAEDEATDSSLDYAGLDFYLAPITVTAGASKSWFPTTVNHLTQRLTNGNFPEGTTFTVTSTLGDDVFTVDDTQNLAYAIPEDAQPGAYTATVTATFPDKSSVTHDVAVNVIPQSEVSGLHFDVESGRADDPFSAERHGADVDGQWPEITARGALPENVTIFDKRKVWLDNGQAGSAVEVPLTATYEDGSTKELSAYFNVEKDPAPARAYAEPVTAARGTSVTFPVYAFSEGVAGVSSVSYDGVDKPTGFDTYGGAVTVHVPDNAPDTMTIPLSVYGYDRSTEIKTTAVIHVTDAVEPVYRLSYNKSVREIYRGFKHRKDLFNVYSQLGWVPQNDITYTVGDNDMGATVEDSHLMFTPPMDASGVKTIPVTAALPGGKKLTVTYQFKVVPQAESKDFDTTFYERTSVEGADGSTTSWLHEYNYGIKSDYFLRDRPYTIALGSDAPKDATIDDHGDVTIPNSLVTDTNEVIVPVVFTFADGSSFVRKALFSRDGKLRAKHQVPVDDEIVLTPTKNPENSRQFIGFKFRNTLNDQIYHVDVSACELLNRDEITGIQITEQPDAACGYLISPGTAKPGYKAQLKFKVTQEEGSEPITMTTTVSVKTWSQIIENAGWKPTPLTFMANPGVPQEGRVRDSDLWSGSHSFFGSPNSSDITSYELTDTLDGRLSLTEAKDSYSYDPEKRLVITTRDEDAGKTLESTIRMTTVDGSTIDFPVKITVVPAGASPLTFRYRPMLRLATGSEEVSSEPIFTQIVRSPDLLKANAEGVRYELGEGAPSWASIDPETGVVTLKGTTLTKDLYEIPVTAVFPNGAKSTTTLLAAAKMFAHTVDYGRTEYLDVSDSKATTVEPYIGGSSAADAPLTKAVLVHSSHDGITIDEKTGVVTVPYLDEADRNTLDVVAKFTFSDGVELFSRVFTPRSSETVVPRDSQGFVYPWVTAITDDTPHSTSAPHVFNDTWKGEERDKTVTYSLGEGAPAGASISEDGVVTYALPDGTDFQDIEVVRTQKGKTPAHTTVRFTREGYSNAFTAECTGAFGNPQVPSTNILGFKDKRTGEDAQYYGGAPFVVSQKVNNATVEGGSAAVEQHPYARYKDLNYQPYFVRSTLDAGQSQMTVPVTVSYLDGSEQTVNCTVQAATLGELLDADYPSAESSARKPITSQPTISRRSNSWVFWEDYSSTVDRYEFGQPEDEDQANDLKRATLDAATGVVTYTPDESLTPGERVEIPVVVHFTDGSQSKASAEFRVFDSSTYVPADADPVEAAPGGFVIVDFNSFKVADSEYDWGEPLSEVTFSPAGGDWSDFTAKPMPSFSLSDDGENHGAYLLKVPADAAEKDYTLKATATFADGTTQEVTRAVTVKASADSKVPTPTGLSYEETTVPADATTVTSPMPVVDFEDNGQKKPAPFGALGDFTVANDKGHTVTVDRNGRVTVQLTKADENTTLTIPVKADILGKTLTTDAVFNIGTVGEKVTPHNYAGSYPDTSVKQSDSVTITPTLTDNGKKVTLPAEGITFSTNTAGASIDENTGVITYTATDGDATAGQVTIPVAVKLPKGKTLSLNARISVVAKEKPAKTQAETHEPSSKPVSVTAGSAATATITFNTTPEGARYSLGDDKPTGATIEDTTGAVTYAPAQDVAAGTVTIPVTVTYNDDTTDTVDVAFNVQAAKPEKPAKTQAETHEPSSNKVSVVAGSAGTATITIDGKPVGTTFTLDDTSAVTDGVEVAADTGAVTWTAPKDTAAGDYTVTVKITYPDSSTETHPVVFTVAKAATDKPDSGVKDNEHYQPRVPATTDVTTGGHAAATITFDDPDTDAVEQAPAGTTLALAEDAPAGMTLSNDGFVVDYSPADDVAAGETSAVVTVTYPDKTTDDITVTFTVTKPEETPQQADTYTPVAPATVDTPAGTAKTVAITFDDPDTDEVETPPAGTTFTLAETVEGAKINELTGAVTYTPPANATPGTVTIPVLVTYPDKTTKTVQVSFTVKARAEVSLPKVAYNTPTTSGNTTTITPNLTGVTLPEGTVFSLKKGTPKGVKINASTGVVTIAHTDALKGTSLTVTVVATAGSKTTSTDIVVSIPADKPADKPGDKPGGNNPGHKDPGQKDPGQKDPGQKNPGDGGSAGGAGSAVIAIIPIVLALAAAAAALSGAIPGVPAMPGIPAMKLPGMP